MAFVATSGRASQSCGLSACQRFALGEPALLQSFELGLLNHVANAQKEVAAILNQTATDMAEALTSPSFCTTVSETVYITLERNFLLEGSSFFCRKPIKFEQWQRKHVLSPVFEKIDGRRRWDTFLIGLPKKNGKSTLAACVATYALLLDDPFPDALGTAFDREQARVIFNFTKKAFERSPGLRPLVRIYRDALERIDGNGVYRVISSESAAAHGQNPSAVIFDEVWNQPGYELWEALTHSPARSNPFHFVTTYAGYQARNGNLLWDLYSRGLRNDDPKQYTFWRSGPDANLASWVTPEYLGSQRRRLPDHIFRRLHMNEWSMAEETKVFRVPAECWTGAFEDFIPTTGARRAYAVGIDLAKYRDFTAWAVIRKDVTPFRLVDFGKLPHIDYTKQVDLLAGVLGRFGNPRAVVDAGAAGPAVIELMRQRGLQIEEFKFSSESKAKIVTDLVVAFEQRKLLLPAAGRTLDESRAIHDLEAELFNFEPTVLRSGNVRYEAAGGYFDDLVMALCLSYSEASRLVRVLFMPEVWEISTNVDPGPESGEPWKDAYADLGPYDFGPEEWWTQLN